MSTSPWHSTPVLLTSPHAKLCVRVKVLQAAATSTHGMTNVNCERVPWALRVHLHPELLRTASRCPQPKLLLHPQKLPLLHLPSMHVMMGAMDATQGLVEYVWWCQALVTGHVTVGMGMSVLKGATVHMQGTHVH